MKLEWRRHRAGGSYLADPTQRYPNRAYIGDGGGMEIWKEGTLENGGDCEWEVVEEPYPMTTEEKKAYLEVLVRMGEVP